MVIAAEGEVTIEHGGEVVARHRLVAPGEVSLVDEHYGGPRRGPSRALRPRSASERAFLSLGPTAEAFVRNAAAAGATKLASQLGLIAAMEAAWGREALVAALGRAVAFRRFKASDVRSILEAGAGVPELGPRPHCQRTTLRTRSRGRRPACPTRLGHAVDGADRSVTPPVSSPVQE